jgi:L-ribulose-5-phosphate 4-epimerase
MLLEDLRAKVATTAQKMVADGLAYGFQGNISALDPDTGLIAITPSGVDHVTVQPLDVVVVDNEGRVVEGERRPTSETPMHTAFYRVRSDVGAVVHSHALHATAFAIAGEPIPLVLAETALSLGGPVPVAPYRRPGSADLAQVVLETVGAGTSALLANHGLITVGANLKQAYAAAIAAEETARLLIMVRSMGAKPMILDDNEARVMREMYLDYYQTMLAQGD